MDPITKMNLVIFFFSFFNLNYKDYFINCISLISRDGQPVFPAQENDSLVHNNNISPKVSPSVNGMLHILMLSPIYSFFLFCLFVCLVMILFSV